MTVRSTLYSSDKDVSVVKVVEGDGLAVVADCDMLVQICFYSPGERFEIQRYADNNKKVTRICCVDEDRREMRKADVYMFSSIIIEQLQAGRMMLWI